jgi:ATP citrate (pro-S)-lyase
MTREKEHQGKIFIIGGGIANFTDVAATFTGLINAIMAFQEDLKTHRVKVWVREIERNLAIYNLI